MILSLNVELFQDDVALQMLFAQFELENISHESTNNFATQCTNWNLNFLAPCRRINQKKNLLMCISCKVVNFLTFSVLIMRLPVVDGTEGLITWWWFQHYGCINHNTLITPWMQKWHTKEMWKTRHFKVCTCPSNIELILLTLRLDLAQKKRRQQEPERSYKMQKGKKRSGKRWKQKSA